MTIDEEGVYNSISFSITAFSKKNIACQHTIIITIIILIIIIMMMFYSARI